MFDLQTCLEVLAGSRGSGDVYFFASLVPTVLATVLSFYLIRLTF